MLETIVQELWQDHVAPCFGLFSDCMRVFSCSRALRACKPRRPTRYHHHHKYAIHARSARAVDVCTELLTESIDCLQMSLTDRTACLSLHRLSTQYLSLSHLREIRISILPQCMPTCTPFAFGLLHQLNQRSCPLLEHLSLPLCACRKTSCQQTLNLALGCLESCPSLQVFDVTALKDMNSTFVWMFGLVRALSVLTSSSLKSFPDAFYREGVKDWISLLRLRDLVFSEVIHVPCELMLDISCMLDLLVDGTDTFFIDHLMGMAADLIGEGCDSLRRLGLRVRTCQGLGKVFRKIRRCKHLEHLYVEIVRSTPHPSFEILRECVQNVKRVEIIFDSYSSWFKDDCDGLGKRCERL